jgi:hypothetical protein
MSVTVQDGRHGGDGSHTSQFGGEILIVLVSPRPIDVGKHLELPDGSVGTVERTRKRSDSHGVKQTVMRLNPGVKSFDGASAGAVQRIGAVPRPCPPSAGRRLVGVRHSGTR